MYILTAPFVLQIILYFSTVLQTHIVAWLPYLVDGLYFTLSQTHVLTAQGKTAQTMGLVSRCPPLHLDWWCNHKAWKIQMSVIYFIIKLVRVCPDYTIRSPLIWGSYAVYLYSQMVSLSALEGKIQKTTLMLRWGALSNTLLRSHWKWRKSKILEETYLSVIGLYAKAKQWLNLCQFMVSCSVVVSRRTYCSWIKPSVSFLICTFRNLTGKLARLVSELQCVAIWWSGSCLMLCLPSFALPVFCSCWVQEQGYAGI